MHNASDKARDSLEGMVLCNALHTIMYNCHRVKWNSDNSSYATQTTTINSESTVSPLSRYLVRPNSGQVSLPNKSLPKAWLLTSEMWIEEKRGGQKESCWRKGKEETRVKWNSDNSSYATQTTTINSESTVSPLSRYLVRPNSGQVSLPNKSLPKAWLLTSEMWIEEKRGGQKESCWRKGKEETRKRKVRSQNLEEKKKQREEKRLLKNRRKQTKKLKKAWAIIVVENFLQLLISKTTSIAISINTGRKGRSEFGTKFFRCNS